MSKVANMLNMVKILEDGKIHTIQDLADELEVSTRMIRIYKQELEQAGIYIKGKQGINGGYILDNMKNTIDIGLTGEEIYQLKNMKKNELDEAIIDKIIKAYMTNEHRKDSTKSEQLMPEFTEIYKILCKHKILYVWLIVYNKREKFFSNFSLNLNLNYSASAFSTSTIAVFCIGILQFLLLPNSTITISS